MQKLLILVLLFWTVTGFEASSQVESTKRLTLEAATRIADAAEIRAREDNWYVVIAIVDDGGHLVLLKRMDGVQTASVEIAIAKARTAAYYRRSTKIFQERVAGGDHAVLSLPHMLPFEGGLPIHDDGFVVGGIGISGVTPQQDGIIAQAGINAF